MYASRREFLRSASIYLSAMVLVRLPRVPGFAPGTTHSPHTRLRQAWFDLLDPGFQIPARINESHPRQMESISHHQAALDDLLSTGEMDFETARQLQSAYRAAARLAGGLEISPTSKDEIRSYDSGVLAAAMLLRQCRLLARMAARRTPSPETSAEAERAIARAIFLIHPVQAENRRVSKYAYRPGPGQRLSFDELYLQVSPVSQAAARFLVDVVSVRHSG